MHQFLVGQLHSTIAEDISKLPKVEYLLVLVAVVLTLRGKKKAYSSLKEVREQAEILEKTRGANLVENLEDYVQNLSDRGILEIRSLNEIGINGVPAENLESFLESLFDRLRRGLVKEDKGRGRE
jgi:hypothetical protein